MPSYRENQFISDWLRPQAGEYTNAPFIYPRRRVRTFDDVRTRVEAGLTLETSRRVATDLDRGFIRNLAKSSSMGTIKKQRLNFQFNPSDIEQAVSMRQDIYLPILQDPSQYAQPMSAVATFNFDLLFDRTMEVGRGRGRGGTTDLMGDIDPAEAVYQIGVLSDLQVLYGIIGQGFSNDFIAQQLETIKVQAKAAAKSEYASDDAEYTKAISEIESTTVESFQGSANLGNNAFLIPMPVRIVFSELFMVDGFVTGTTVRFTKFNTNMVPIQASVGLSMNALYIGFAKEETFLTVQLGNLEEELNKKRIETIEDNRETLNAVRQSARQFSFSCWSEYEWKAAIYKSFGMKNYTGDKTGDSGTRTWAVDQYFSAGFKDAVTQGEGDKVLQLFKEGKSASISYNWTFKVYGPYNTFAIASTDKNRSTRTAPVVGLFTSGTVTATDEESWRKMRAGRFDDTENTGATTNQASNKLTGLYDVEDLSTKYFLVELFVTVTAGGITQEFQGSKIASGDGKFIFNKNITWPSFEQPYRTTTATTRQTTDTVNQRALGVTENRS